MNTFSISEALSFGWNTFKNNVSTFLIILAVLGAIQVASVLVGQVFEDQVAIALILNLAVTVLSIIVSLGVMKMILDLVDGKAANIGDLYGQTPLILNYLGASILSGLIIFAGFLLLIIPGIYLMVKLSFASYVVIDKKAGPIDAIKASYNMTKGNWWNIVFLGIASSFVILAGAIALLVGLVVAIPVVMIAYAYAYRKLSGSTGAVAAPAPAAPMPAPATPTTATVPPVGQ